MSLRPSLLCPLGFSLSLSLSIVCSPHSPQPAPTPAHTVSRPYARPSPLCLHLSLLGLLGLLSPSPGPLCAHPPPPPPCHFEARRSTLAPLSVPVSPALSWAFPLPLCRALTHAPQPTLSPSPWASLHDVHDQLRVRLRSSNGANIKRRPTRLVRTNACTHVEPVPSSPEARHFEALRAVNE